MKRLPMRKIREALRLRADGFSGRQVAQSLAVGRATISEYFRRAEIVEGLALAAAQPICRMRSLSAVCFPIPAVRHVVLFLNLIGPTLHAGDAAQGCNAISAPGLVCYSFGIPFSSRL